MFLTAMIALFSAVPAAQAASSPVTQADLCRAWSATTASPKIALSNGLNVTASRALRVGSSCLAKNAEIRLTGAKVVDPGPAGPSGTAAAQVLAAITRAAGVDTGLKQGDELFKGAFLTQFNASLKIGYFDINGAVELKFTGGTVSRFLFKGRLYGVDRLSVTVYSPPGGTKLPNIGGTPVMYNGTLSLTGKKYTLNLTGSAPAVTVTYGGETIGVKDATIVLNLKDQGDGQRLHADVTGDITVGTAAHVNGKVSADFDDAGLTALSGGGDLSVQIPAKGSSPSGSISGNAVFAYTKDPLSTQITFAGDVRVGDALVTSASGTLDDNAASFKGDATYTTDLLTAKGAVEGDVFFGDDLTGRTVTNKAGAQVPATKGDLYLKTASADVTTKGVTVSGAAQIGLVGDEQWVKANGAVDLSFTVAAAETNVKGSATVDWLVGTTPKVAFDGSVVSGSTAIANAKGELDGQKIALAGDVTVSNPDLTIKGAVDGTLFYGNDLSGLTIKNHAGTAVAATKGDFALKTLSATVNTKGFAVTGTAAITRVGAERFAVASGAVDATYNGTNLKGSADIDWVSGSIPAVNFSGSVANGGVQVASVTGSVDGSKLALKGNATVNSNGFALKGAIDGLVFYGSDLSGQTITGRDGKDVAATKGDFLVKSASAEVSGKGITVTGNASLGKVGSQIWAKGGGTVDLTYGATKLKGSASADWVNGQVPSVTFAGSVTNGTTLVANASGTFDGNKIAIKGDASFTDAGATIKGAVDGVVFYGADLSAEKVANRAGVQVTPTKGDYVLKSATGSVVVKGLTLTGGIGLSSVAGEKWATTSGTIDATYNGTTIKGSASASWVNGGESAVSFDGTVTSGDTVITGKGQIDGKKIAINGSVSTVVSGFSLKGAVDGVVFYGADLTGETVTNRAGAQVQATKGDVFVKSASGSIETKGLTLTGAATVGIVGSEKWVKGGGTIDATYNGTNVKGSGDIDWTVGTTPILNFTGSLSTGGVEVASASGTIDGAKIALKGAATVNSNGFTVKGAIDGVVFYGNDLTGVTVTGRDGKDVAATKGDFLIKSASADVSGKGITVKGNVSVGKVGAQIWAKGGGSLDVTYNGTNLKGSATADWVMGSIPTVTFAGSVTNGTTVVANASGAFDGNKIAIKGDASFTDAGVALKGAVDGVVFYGADLSGEKVTNRAGVEVTPAKGDYVLKSATGSVVVKGLTLSGGLGLASVAGDKWATVGGTIDATYNGTTIKGSASASWVNGGESAVSFEGTVTSGDTVISGKGSVDGKKITLSGTAQTSNANLSLKGAVTDAVVFYGSDLTGEKVTNRAGAQVQATKGDVFVKSASADVTTKGISVKGAVTVGVVGAEKWIKGSGALDVTYNGTNVKGTADFDWLVGTTPSVTFAGSLTSGTTLVAKASGTLDGKKIALKGDLSLTEPTFAVKAAVDGVVFYGADLTGETAKSRTGASVQPAKGDFVVSAASASVTVKNLAVTGDLTLGNLAGEKWATVGGTIDATYNGTTIKGAANASWIAGGAASVSFDGTVTSGDTKITGKGTIDGNKIAIAGSAQTSNSSLALKGGIDGVVFYGSDLSAEKITNRAGAQVTPVKGDFLVKSASADVTAKNLAVSGAFTLGSVGTEKWIKGSGSLDATYGATNVKGTASIDWLVGTTPSVAFDGSVKSGTTIMASAKGTVDGNKIALKADATVTESAFAFKGAVDGVVFYGSDLSAEKVTNRAGAQVTPAKGDFVVKSASAELTAKGLTVTGAGALASVGGDLWASGSGTIDATYGTANVKGSATVAWVKGQVPSITFKGGFTNGTTTVANAEGQIDGKKIALKGDLALSDPNLSLKAAVDGVLYYGADLTGETATGRTGAQVQPAKGDYVLKAASVSVSVKNLAVTGDLTLGSLAGEKWATVGGSIDATYNGTSIKGSANVGWIAGQIPSVSFDGTIVSGDTTITGKGTIDGSKIAIAGSAKTSNANLSLSGAVDGVVFYGSDLTGQTIANRAGTQVQATKGDFNVKSASANVTAKGLAVSGSVSLGSVGAEKWVKGGGNVDVTYGATNVKGSATIDWLVGTIPSVTFAGAVKQGDVEIASASGTLDGAKIALKGQAQLSNANLSVKGAVDGVVFYGNDLSAEKVANRSGAQVTPNKGDFLVKSASATLVAKGLTVSGNVSLGKVGSDIWAKGGGAVDLTYNGTVLKGSADVDWVQGQIPSVSFAGSVTNGTALVASASGVVDGKKIQLKGDATVVDNGTTYKGAVDGVVFYGADLAGQQIADKSGALVEPLKGDYNFKGVSGSVETKGLTASLGLAFGNVRGVKWLTGGGAVDLRWTNPGQPENRIQGTASLDANGLVKFAGSYSAGDVQMASVSGTADGKKLTITGDLTTPTASGKATGTLFYGTDLSGETIQNKAGATVAASRGDFSLKVTDGRVTLKQLVATAQFSASKVGGNWWLSAAAQVKVGSSWLTFTGDVDSSGDFVLKGQGSVLLDGYHVDFNGTALVRNNRFVLDGTVAIVTNLFKVQLTGTIEKPNMDVNTYVFTGKASFKFGAFQVADATVRLTVGEGLATTFSIKTCFLFICPNSTWKLYFNDGTLARAELNAPIAWVAQFLAIGSIAIPNVPISTSITGII